MQEELEKLKSKILAIWKYIDVGDTDKEDEFRVHIEDFAEKIDELIRWIEDNPTEAEVKEAKEELAIMNRTYEGSV